jgi:hypothetical protein
MYVSVSLHSTGRSSVSSVSRSPHFCTTMMSCVKLLARRVAQSWIFPGCGAASLVVRTQTSKFRVRRFKFDYPARLSTVFYLTRSLWLSAVLSLWLRGELVLCAVEHFPPFSVFIFARLARLIDVITSGCLFCDMPSRYIKYKLY